MTVLEGSPCIAVSTKCFTVSKLASFIKPELRMAPAPAINRALDIAHRLVAALTVKYIDVEHNTTMNCCTASYIAIAIDCFKTFHLSYSNRHRALDLTLKHMLTF